VLDKVGLINIHGIVADVATWRTKWD